MTTSGASAVEDAYLRWRAAGELTEPVLVEDGHVAWCWMRDHDAGDNQVWATVVGDDPVVVTHLIDRLAEVTTFDGVTVRERVVPGLPPRLRPYASRGWCSWTLDPAVAAPWPVESAVVDLGRADARIDALLDHSASAYIRSGDRQVTHWVGVEDGDRLLAVGASHPEPSGAAHLVSICTRPDHRGRGLAEHVVRALVRHARDDGAAVVYLEMYADNEAGRRLYRRLGMTEHPTYVSGALPTGQ